MDEKLQQLCEKPFALDEHDFIWKNDAKTSGTPFIKKDAIRRRLSQLDAHWKSTPPEVQCITGDVVIMRGGLTLQGDTRFAIGTGIVQTERRGKDGKPPTPITGYDLAREIAKAHKTAQSDLLPRCAAEWNIGWYMRDSRAKGIANAAALDKYLKQIAAEGDMRQHWAVNGKGDAFKAISTALGIRWEVIKTQLEPGRTLTGLSDITLSFDDAVKALMLLQTPPVPNASKPAVSVSGSA
jgi:hypothetical protein